MKKLILLQSLLLLASMIYSQHRVAIYDVERPVGSSSMLDNVSSYMVGFYSNDDRFIVIDKANSQLVKDEQDRQKSEEFIDGYIVQQGAQEGFDYLFYPKYFKKDKILTVKVYDVAKGTSIASQSVELKTSLLGLPKELKLKVNRLVDKINSKCFNLRYEIVRCIDKKKKSDAKELLFALGYNQKAREDAEFEIYQMITETVGGKKIERKEVIGMGKIDEVQDENFSVLKVAKGGEAIMTALNNQIKLYGTLKQ